MEPPFTQRSASYTTRGRRYVNQDAVVAMVLPGGGELIAVADGMGGHNAGEVASAQAVESLHSALAADPDLAGAVRSANAFVLEASARPEYRGMGTTLVALLRQGPTYFIANVGDSRAYRVDSRGITQLTRDHSFVAEAVGSGEMTEQDAERSRWRNAVTRSLGTDANLDVDCYGPFDAEEPHAVMLCTDGVYRVVAEDTMRALVRRSVGAREAVRTLVHAAFDAGSDDNMSAALVNFGLVEAVVEPAPGKAGEHTVGRAGEHASADPALERRRLRRRARARRRTLIEATVIVLVTIATVVFVALRWLIP